jgi:competence protein ComEA
MKLPILLVALIAITACRSTESATNSNSVGRSVTQRNAGSCINLNLATANELAKLPGIGKVMADRIIDYRMRNGRFRNPEEIIIIEGFSERKYSAIAEMICVE